jgi:hypothetical protein
VSFTSTVFFYHPLVYSKAMALKHRLFQIILNLEKRLNMRGANKENRAQTKQRKKKKEKDK